MLGGDDPVVTDLLGETGDLGQNLGLSNDFCYQVIKQVGNYEEIYNRNLGPDTQFDLPRGLNALVHRRWHFVPHSIQIICKLVCRANQIGSPYFHLIQMQFVHSPRPVAVVSKLANSTGVVAYVNRE